MTLEVFLCKTFEEKKFAIHVAFLIPRKTEHRKVVRRPSDFRLAERIGLPRDKGRL